VALYDSLLPIPLLLLDLARRFRLGSGNMDTGRLRSTIEILLEEEAELGIDSKIQALVTDLSNLSSSPSEQSYQVSVKRSLDNLKQVFKKLVLEEDPTFVPYAEIVRAMPFFGRELLVTIEGLIAENQMTPAAAVQAISAIQSERQNYLGQLRTLDTSLQALGIGAEQLEEGDSQIGFRIPREIFDNELKGWVSELRELSKIIRPFSEIATGSTENIEIGEISTTDPIIFLILSAPTIAMIRRAVSWSLDQWKKVEDIRKVRAETRRINIDNGGALDDIVASFEERIKSVVDASVRQFSAELVGPEERQGRQHELVTEMQHSLASMLARIERGMTIELRYLPRSDADAASPEEVSAMSDMDDTIPLLKFPPASPSPVLTLPRPPSEPDEPEGGVRTRRATKKAG
jgi:hypothetical protein